MRKKGSKKKDRRYKKKSKKQTNKTKLNKQKTRKKQKKKKKNIRKNTSPLSCWKFGLLRAEFSLPFLNKIFTLQRERNHLPELWVYSSSMSEIPGFFFCFVLFFIRYFSIQLFHNRK